MARCWGMKRANFLKKAFISLITRFFKGKNYPPGDAVDSSSLTGCPQLSGYNLEQASEQKPGPHLTFLERPC